MLLLVRRYVSRVIRDIFKPDELRANFGDGKGLDGQKLLEWLVGSHSKCLETYCNGSRPRNSLDIHHVRQKCQVDVYVVVVVDTIVPSPDTQVCSAFCAGGAPSGTT